MNQLAQTVSPDSRWVATSLSRDESVLQRAALSIRARKLLAVFREPREVSVAAANTATPLAEAQAIIARLAELGLLAPEAASPGVALADLRGRPSGVAATNSRWIIAAAVLAALGVGAYLLAGGSRSSIPTAGAPNGPAGPTAAAPKPEADPLAPILKAAAEAGSAAAIAAAETASARAERQAAAEARAAAEAKAAAEARAARQGARESAAAPQPLTAPTVTGTQAPVASAPAAAPTPSPAPPAPAPVAAATATPAPAPAAPAPAPAPAPVAVAAAPAPAPAAAPPAPPREPRLVNRVEPIFPRNADVNSGTVRARLTVNGNGVVTNVEIVSASPPRVFDRAVINALSQWRYEGTGAPSTTLAEISFQR